MPVEVRPLTGADHPAWLELWRGYLAFYEVDIPEAITALTWARLLDPAESLYGAVAVEPGRARPIGLTHWLVHRSTWADVGYAYLEDLFVAEDARGLGAGEALIAHVRDAARAFGCAKLYWLTRETNARARALYDRVAERTGFIQYQILL